MTTEDRRRDLWASVVIAAVGAGHGSKAAREMADDVLEDFDERFTESEKGQFREAQPKLPCDPDLLWLVEGADGTCRVQDEATRSCNPFIVGNRSACLDWMDRNRERWLATLT
jgi:hypothetical protein